MTTPATMMEVRESVSRAYKLIAQADREIAERIRFHDDSPMHEREAAVAIRLLEKQVHAALTTWI